jgi:hypothetical protein
MTVVSGEKSSYYVEDFMIFFLNILRSEQVINFSKKV